MCLCGKQEQHISADVAYAVWQYWQATGDDGFLLDAGAEILLETGRFWSSRAQPEADGYCHIRGVIGPDEYHEHIDDNAFTNVMARWNIRRALDVAALLRERWPERWAGLVLRLGLDDTELQQWMKVAETMATGLDVCNRDCSSSSRAFSLSKKSIWRTMQAVPCQWTWCLGESGRNDPRWSSRPMSWHFWGCCRRSSIGETERGELPLLRASMQPRQLAEPGHACARRCPAGIFRNGAALFPADRGD